MHIFKDNYHIIRVILIGFVLMITSQATAADADKIIKNIQKKYRSSKTIEIQFKEVSRFSLTDMQTEMNGTLLMEGQDKFRFESENQVLVNDGKTLWRYNPLDNQVLIDHAKKSEEDVMLNKLIFEIKDHYYGQLLEEKKVGKVKEYAIKLTPKPESQSFFTSIQLWVVDKTWEIKRLIYIDYNDNQVEYQVNSLKFDPTIINSTFVFDPPEGTQVVDLRF